MKTLDDFKNGIARQLQYEDWNEMVDIQKGFGKYPSREHDRAAEMYANYRATQERKNKQKNISLEDAVKLHRATQSLVGVKIIKGT